MGHLAAAIGVGNAGAAAILFVEPLADDSKMHLVPSPWEVWQIGETDFLIAGQVDTVNCKPEKGQDCTMTDPVCLLTFVQAEGRKCQ